MTSFISYSGDYNRVATLVETLRRQGLRTWRDQDSLGSGQATYDEIAAELERCDATLLWLGGGTLESDYVCKIEIPLGVESSRRRGMRIVPLFVDMGARDGINAVRRATGYEIGDHNGHVLRPGEVLAAFLGRVANGEVRAALQRPAAEGRRPVLRCVTRSDVAGGRADANLNFDWIREYASDGRLPDHQTATALQRALHTSMQHVHTVFGSGIVDLHLSCHLHIGVALGFELRRVTGAIPRVAVGSGWWTCGMVPATAASPLSERASVGPVTATRSAVEIGLSRDIDRAVSAHIAATDVRYRERIRLAPPDGPDQQAVTQSSLNVWAEQAADAIRRARARPGVDAVDVFLAAPIGFALALGWRLNAVGGVCLFHPEGNAGPYRHVWTLQPS